MLAKSNAVGYRENASIPVWEIGQRTSHADVHNEAISWSRGLLFMVCLAAVFILTIMLPYGSHIWISEKGQELQQLRGSVVQLTKENEVLQLKVNQLKSLERIQAIAETELGMGIPRTAVYSSVAMRSTVK